jgi:hypothetical protein
MDLKRYTELRSQVESLQRKAERSKGALQVTLDQLKNEFGVTSVEEAKKLLDQKKIAKEQLETKLETLIISFEEKWSDKLKV